MTAGEKLAIGVKIVVARLTGRARPFLVDYAVLNACNAACGYCNSPHRADPQLDTTEHQRLIAAFASLGAVRITFVGGEPLLRRDIGDLVSITRLFGMRAAMVTNGFLVCDKLAIVRQLDEVVISIDGREPAHDRQRGAGSWKRAMRAIEACAAERLRLSLNAVITRESASEIDWLIETAVRFGVTIGFQVPQTNSELFGAGAQALAPDHAEARNILRRILDAKAAGAPVRFSRDAHETALEWWDYGVDRIERPGERSPCTAGTFFLHVEPNGDIYPCLLHVGTGTFKPLNAARHGVEAAWQHAMRHSCFACFNTQLNENRGLFDLRPGALFDAWRGSNRPRRSFAAPRDHGIDARGATGGQ